MNELESLLTVLSAGALTLAFPLAMLAVVGYLARQLWLARARGRQRALHAVWGHFVALGYSIIDIRWGGDVVPPLFFARRGSFVFQVLVRDNSGVRRTAWVRSGAPNLTVVWAKNNPKE